MKNCKETATPKLSDNENDRDKDEKEEYKSSSSKSEDDEAGPRHKKTKLANPFFSKDTVASSTGASASNSAATASTGDALSFDLGNDAAKKKDKTSSSHEDDDSSSEFEDSSADESSDEGGGGGGDDEGGGSCDVDPTADTDDADPLIAALRKAKEKPVRRAPPDIECAAALADISFHPERPLIAAAAVDGPISLFHYHNDGNKLAKKLQLHKKTVRSIEFDGDGARLYSASKDKSFKVTDVETFQVVHKRLAAHDSPLFCVRPIDAHLCATGDEDGVVKLWDVRSPQKSVMSAKPFEEFVSNLLISDDCRTMVASSGEGTLTGFNVRARKAEMQSEVYEGELTGLGVVRGGASLVAGCADGKLYMFKWSEWGYHADRFAGHPDAINDLVAVTDNVVLTACEDGVIRAVHLYPHRFLGVVGNHEHEFPVEKLDISMGGDIVASISHDQKIKFWSVKYLEEMEYNKTKKPFKHRGKQKIRRKESKMQQAREKEFQLPSSNRANKSDFFSGLD